MPSRHRFLQKSIHHVSFHNRLTEEETMWRRRENEQQERRPGEQRDRSRTERDRPASSSDRGRSRRDSPEAAKINRPTETDFGPPLPSNLGINADRWDHAFFMERYPNEHEKRATAKRKTSPDTGDDDEERKKTKHHRRKRLDDQSQKKEKRRRRHDHRSRS